MISIKAKYIIRLDDACYQMPIKKWEKFEAFFIKNGIKPIVGVVPDNKDEKLGNEYDHDLWLKVKKWDNLGEYCITWTKSSTKANRTIQQFLWFWKKI